MSEEKTLTVGQLKPKPEVYELDPSKPYIVVIPDRVTNNEAIGLVESLGNHGVRATIVCSDKVRIFESIPVVPILAPMVPVEVPAPAKKVRARKESAKKSVRPRKQKAEKSATE